MNKTLFAIIGLLVLIGIGFGGMEIARRSSSQGATPLDTSSSASVGSVPDEQGAATETPESVQPSTSDTAVAENPAQPGTYTMTEVRTHNTASSCWSVVQGVVYDLTSWISKHPGGAKAIKQLCGTDGTDKFVGKHGGMEKQEMTLASFKIGILAQ
ncbi:hypothetical protein FJY93_03860 [Candidatus Kaiserbacteria bacterium]|nr:hypothetical protein [Candidatus Kaiserbacteria bacterium]